MPEYDFIVVGTGSAGSTIAARLTEIPGVEVLALEAGQPEIPADVANPSLWYTLFGSSIDWAYLSVPQAALGGRTTFEPRGKALGGSSNLNLMIHIRGHRSDYDNWAYNGCPGWSYDECLPWFQKLEDQEDDSHSLAGRGGPLHVSNARLHDPSPTASAFLEACEERGYPMTDDFNGPEMIGAGWHHITVKDGVRQTTKVAYLDPAADRPNLTLSTGSQATRLLFEANRCVAVEYVKDGMGHTATARREVLVCSGAIESPKLLLLSGIGAPAQLAANGIPPRVALPGVGENFHNHVLTGVVSECRLPVPPPHQNLSEAALFWKSDPGWPAPDIQIAYVDAPFGFEIWREHPNSVSILPGVIRPMSRGWIRLDGPDPLAKPLVNPNYLAARADLDRLVTGIRMARELFATKAMSEWIDRELSPGPDLDSDADLEEFARASADSYHHQSGSCKMGMDEWAVVDPQLRVYGVEGLRVADASVMPTVPSGNCHTAVVMIAERLSDQLKKEHHL
ncbi:MAG: choline dehydrogenase [Acidimicrobiaceae bacterium]|jgi:choline dehydrogenase|nr:choline dehydrogenase [Acidimicrobiaceae bacterium]